jgi:chromate transporter
MIDPVLYFLLFLKATLFSSGGFGNLASLRQDLLGRGWANTTQFGQSLAIGQISPGPNGLWVICLGYLTYGYLGALLALIAITFPPLLVLLISGLYGRIERQIWVTGLMRGISLAAVGIVLTAVWAIISRSSTDWKSWLIAAAACVLALDRRSNILIILGLAGLAGFFVYYHP